VAKEIIRIAKLQFNAGQAKPGPELASLGIVMPKFSKEFNDKTKDRGDEPVPVTITIYKDKTFTFKTHTAPASYMILKAAKVKKGSENSKTNKIGTISKDDLKKIAKYKLEDLNTHDVEAAMRTIAGTAKNLGILIKGIDNIEAELAAAKEAAKAEELAAAKEAQLVEEAEAAKESKEFVEAETEHGSNDEEKKDSSKNKNKEEIK
jgi:large subunit ribosomal protein L11